MISQQFAWEYSFYGEQGDEVTVGITVPGEIHLRIRSAPFANSDDGPRQFDEVAASLSPVQVAVLSEKLAAVVRRQHWIRQQYEIEQFRARLSEVSETPPS